MFEAIKEIFAQLESFLGEYSMRNFRKGHNLMYPGDPNTSTFFLKEGRVKQYAISDEGNEVIINVFGSNTFFPIILTDSSCEYYYDALSDIKVQTVPREAFLAQIIKTPQLMTGLLQYMQHFNQATLRRMTYLMASTAYYRLIYEIINECQFYSIEEKHSYILDIREHEIASRAGMSRETASRQMKKLKLKKLVNVTHRTIEVINFSGLQKELGAHI